MTAPAAPAAPAARHSYTEEFRRVAVDLVAVERLTVAEAAR